MYRNVTEEDDINAEIDDVHVQTSDLKFLLVSRYRDARYFCLSAPPLGAVS